MSSNFYWSVLGAFLLSTMIVLSQITLTDTIKQRSMSTGQVFKYRSGGWQLLKVPPHLSFKYVPAWQNTLLRQKASVGGGLLISRRFADIKIILYFSAPPTSS